MKSYEHMTWDGGLVSTYVDHAFRHGAATYSCFKANGIAGVCRYYDGGRVPGKGLTLAEAKDIKAAGLHIHAVYETSGGADIPGFPQDGAYFTHAQGWNDWMEAVVDANRAHQPKETPIFLAVDRHMNTDEQRVRLYAYFEGASDADASIGASGYFIGCYGPDYVCEFIRDSFGIQHLWPWLPRPPAIPDFDYDLWQQENGQTLCGVAVDFNDCQIEGWVTEEDELSPEEFERLFLQNLAKHVTPTIEAMKQQYDPIAAEYPKHEHDTTGPRPVL